MNLSLYPIVSGMYPLCIRYVATCVATYRDTVATVATKLFNFNRLVKYDEKINSLTFSSGYSGNMSTPVATEWLRGGYKTQSKWIQHDT